MGITKIEFVDVVGEGPFANGKEGNCPREAPLDGKIAIQYKQRLDPKAAVGCFSYWCFSGDTKTHISSHARVSAG